MRDFKWKDGDPCWVIEHEGQPPLPKPDGRRLPGSVTNVAGGFVHAFVLGTVRPGGMLATTELTFDATSGWLAEPPESQFQWRLTRDQAPGSGARNLIRRWLG